jgi:DNA invertase Pin-like site-specific DNA recombinase
VSAPIAKPSGFGLDVQLDAVQRWVQASGHDLIAVLRDEGISGTRDAADRPGLSDVVTAVESGVAQGLVVARLDRLARSLTVQEAVLATVLKAGGKVFSVDVGEVLEDDPDDPMRTFVRQVMGAAAQLERGMIAARLRAGRRQKHLSGGFAYGSPPLGYRSVKGELVPDLEEQRALARIRQLRAQGATLTVIAQTLEAEGIPTKRGRRWNVGTLSRVVRRLEGSKAA